MVRSRKKKALYEVMGQVLSKRNFAEPAQPAEASQSSPSSVQKDNFARQFGRTVPGWTGKPRLIQFTAERLELSLPYSVVVAVLLGVVLLGLVFHRLGQRSSVGIKTAEAETVVVPQEPAAEVRSSMPLNAVTEPVVLAEAETPAVSESGNNRIVIQTYQVRSQLEPVKRYFASYGIETEVVTIGEWYYLVTRDKYENPEKAGTDGYAAKQMIIELGANYKAPAGYESFGTRPFHDAYGMRFDD